MKKFIILFTIFAFPVIAEGNICASSFDICVGKVLIGTTEQCSVLVDASVLEEMENIGIREWVSACEEATKDD